jgi:uncharacterized repeat protein (TIGR02543 family)
MIAVPFTAINFGGEYSSAEPSGNIIYDANGGTWPGAQPSYSRGLHEEYTVQFENIPQRAGYFFTGWSLTSGNTPDFESEIGNWDSRTLTVDSASLTLYACWKQYDRKITLSNQSSISTTSIGSGDAGKYILIEGGGNNNRIQIDVGSGKVHVLVQDLRANNSSNGSVFDIRNGNVVMQYAGSNDFIENSNHNAVIHVSGGASLILQGQGNSALTIQKTSTADHSGGAGIGGNGNDGGAPGKNNGLDAGNIQVESGVLTISMRSSVGGGTCYSGIGGGGSTFGYAGDAKGVYMYGGTTTITIAGQYVNSSGIGGGASRNGTAGDGNVFIKGGNININLSSNTADNEEITGSGMGGGGSWDGRGGKGNVTIDGGIVDISVITTDRTPASGIGGGGSYNGSNGGDGNVAINGGTVKIQMGDISRGYLLGIYGAGIGGGGIEGNGTAGEGVVTITGGDVSVSKKHSNTNNGKSSGAGIGGGGSGESGSSNPNTGQVTISGGNVYVDMTARSGDQFTGAGIGGGGYGHSANSNKGAAGTVTVTGGTVTVNRAGSAGQDIGGGGNITNSATVDGGSIRLTGSDGGTLSSPKDSKGNALYKTTVPDTGDSASVFVKRAAASGWLKNGSPYYSDFGITSSHKLGAAAKDTKLYLYLPAAQASDPNGISVETDGKTGFVNYYTSSGNSGTVTAVRGNDPAIPNGTTVSGGYSRYYRIIYKLAQGIDRTHDIVHYSDSASFFSQEFTSDSSHTLQGTLRYLYMYKSNGTTDTWYPLSENKPYTYALVPAYDPDNPDWDSTRRTSPFSMTAPVTGKLVIAVGSSETATLSFHDPVSGHNNSVKTLHAGIGYLVNLNEPTASWGWSTVFQDYQLIGWQDSQGKRYFLEDPLVLRETSETLTALWGAVLELDINDSGGGDLQYNIENGPWTDYGGRVMVDLGKKVGVKITATSGYQFLHWSDGTRGYISDTITDIVLNHNTEYKAYVSSDAVRLHLSFAGAGKTAVSAVYSASERVNISPEFSSDQVLLFDKNTTLALTAAATGTNNKFSYWQGDWDGDTVSTFNPLGFNATLDNTYVKAVFTTGAGVGLTIVSDPAAAGTFEFRVSTDGGSTYSGYGPVSLVSGTGIIWTDPTTYVDYTANAESGYVFSRWTTDYDLKGPGVTGSGEPTVTGTVMDTDKESVAHFLANGDYVSLALSARMATSPGVHVPSNIYYEIPGEGKAWTSMNSTLHLPRSSTTYDVGFTHCDSPSGFIFDHWNGSEILGGPTTDTVVMPIGVNTAPVLTAYYYSSSQWLTVEFDAVYIEGGSEKPMLGEVIQYSYDGNTYRVAHGESDAMPPNRNITITTLPSGGYSFSRWVTDDQNIGNTNSGTITLNVSVLSQTVHIKAIFVPHNAETVVNLQTDEWDGTNYSGIPGAVFKYTIGSEVGYATGMLILPSGTSVSMEVHSGIPSTHSFSTWMGLVNGNSTAAWIGSLPSESHDLTAVFVLTANSVTVYVKSYDDSTGGTVPGASYEYKINGRPFAGMAADIVTAAGDSATVRLVAAPGSYVFSRWTGAASGLDKEGVTVHTGISPDYTVNAWFVPLSGAVYLSLGTLGDGSGDIDVLIDGAVFRTGAPSSNRAVIPIAAGKDVEFIAVPKSPSDAFIWWTGSLSGQTNPETLANIISDKTVDAEFTASGTYTVTSAVSGSGTVQFYQNSIWQAFPSGGTLTVQRDSDLDVKAVPDPGSSFVAWSGDLIGNGPQHTLGVYSDKSITAWFHATADVRILTVDKNGGNVNVGVGTIPAFDYGTLPVNVPNGSQVVLTASKAGSNFSYWEGTVNSSANPLTIGSFGRDHTEKAVFTDLGHGKILTVNDNGGSVTLTVGAITFDYLNPIYIATGTSVILESSASPTGARFSYWSGGISSAANPAPALTVDSDKTVSANYTGSDRGKTLTVSVTGSGTVDITVNGTTFLYPGTPVNIATNSVMSLEAIPSVLPVGNVFIWWSGDLSGHVNPQSLTADDDKTVAALFSDSTYAVTTTASGNGSGKVQFYQNSVWQDFPAGPITVPNGCVLSLTAVATTGEFIRWTGALSGQTNPETLTVDTDKTVNAEFTQSSTYTLNLSATNGGTVEYMDWNSGNVWTVFPAGGMTVPAGQQVEVKTSNGTAGYLFIWWAGTSGDLVSFSSAVSATATITVNHNVTASAVFEFNDGPGGSPDTAYMLNAEYGGTGSGKAQYQYGGVWYDVPSGGKWIPENHVLNIRAVAVTGVFYRWTGDLTSFNAGETVTIDSDKTVKAWFYNGGDLVFITVERDGNGKVEYVFDGSTYEFVYGTATEIPRGNLSITATASSGNSFIWWTGDLTTLNANESLNVNGNKSIKAWFFADGDIAQLTVQKDGTGDGTVSVQRDGAWHVLPYGAVNVPKGNLTFRAAASSGTFFAWTGDLTGTDNPKDLAIDGGEDAIVWFYSSSDFANVTVTREGNGKVEYEFGGTLMEFSYGTVTRLPKVVYDIVATSGSGSTFIWWTGDLTTLNASESLNVNGNKSIKAWFFDNSKISTLDVDMDGDGDGTVSVQRDGVWHDLPYSAVNVPNGDLMVRALAASGSSFVWWTGDLSDIVAQQNLLIDGKKSITAWFYLNGSVTSVTASTIGNGTGYIQFDHEGVWHNFPSSQLTVPNGYHLTIFAVNTQGDFVGWTGAVTGMNNPETFDVGTVPSFVTAEFHVDGYTITTIISGNGWVSPAGSVFIEKHHDQTFVITPGTGSHVIDVIVDNVSIGPMDNYVFFNVDADHMIEVKFSPPPSSGYVVTATAGPGVSVDPSGSRPVPAGSNHTVSWTAEPGYEVVGVVIDGISRPDLVAAGSYTFLSVMSNHAMVVTAAETGIYLDVTVVGGEGHVMYSQDGGQTFTRYNGRVELTPMADIVLLAVPTDGYAVERWEGSVYGTDDRVSIMDVTGSVTETLVFKAAPVNPGSDDFFGSLMFIILMIAVLSILLIGLLMILLASLSRGMVDVVKIDSDNATIIGKKKARANRPYMFSVEGEGTLAYRTGDNTVWKEPVRKDDVYEIPGDDVTDTLMIRVQ